MAEPWEILRLLADPTRLRILLLLRQEELSVNELCEILDMGQSRISSHLAILRQSSAVADRKDGKRTYYSISKEIPDTATRILDATADGNPSEAISSDGSALERALDKRRRRTEAYFNEIAGRLGKNYCPGRSWESIGHFLLRLVPQVDIADLGAGEAVLGQMLARRARSVTCIDSSEKMVEVGLEMATRNGLTNLTYRLGDIESVPLPDESVDLAVLSQALHHARHPSIALSEAFRILRPGGQVLILDLNAHNFEKAREIYFDQWLGFSENGLYALLIEADFEQVEVQIVAREDEEPHFETLLATGLKA